MLFTSGLKPKVRKNSDVILKVRKNLAIIAF